MPITIDEEAVEFKISGFESIEINFEPVDIFLFLLGIRELDGTNSKLRSTLEVTLIT